MVDSIVDYMKRAIADGRFAPGQRLIESEIQIAVGSSRGSVREAMRRLSADDLVEMEYYKGARVKRLTRAEVLDLYRVREAVEGLAAQLATVNAVQPTFRKRLMSLDATFSETYDGSAASFMEYNRNFHNLIVEMSESPRLERLVEQMQIPVFMLRLHPTINRRVAEDAHRQHLAVARALLEGNAKSAEATMRRHVHLMGRDVMKRAPHILD